LLKEDRAKWLSKTLDARGIPEYGRASRISKDIGCANAVATGWIRGTLPRDVVLGFKFCDFYNIDFREWTFGIPSVVVSEQWFEAIATAREFEEAYRNDLTTDQFIGVVKLALKAESPGFLAETLQELGNIFSQTDS
tara:strand:- start:162 stop:572 length:411 start_codon:yes stop_codon:yes gene_type:complete